MPLWLPPVPLLLLVSLSAARVPISDKHYLSLGLWLQRCSLVVLFVDIKALSVSLIRLELVLVGQSMLLDLHVSSHFVEISGLSLWQRDLAGALGMVRNRLVYISDKHYPPVGLRLRRFSLVVSLVDSTHSVFSFVLSWFLLVVKCWWFYSMIGNLLKLAI